MSATVQSLAVASSLPALESRPLGLGKHDVQTTLQYHKDNEDGSPLKPTYVNKPETFARPMETHRVTIRDISGDEDKYTLDGNGFQVHRHTANEKDFWDQDAIRGAYYAEMEQLLKDVTGASRVHVFDHTVRRNAVNSGPRDNSNPVRGPVQRVHVDQSYSASLSRVPHHLPAEAERLLQGRVQIINVWRPIKTVRRDPLAVCDAHSVAEEDLVIRPLIYPNRRGETFTVRYSPQHRWFYRHGLTPDDVLLVKCFDSKVDGRARRTPHSAFVDPAVGDHVEPRESIEVRALVFHPDDRE